jgi:lysozyme
MRQGLRAILLLGAVLLAGCGGGPAPDLPRASGIPAAFGDSDPHDWEGASPARHEVHGVDVSKWNGTIDWSEAAGAGLAFVYIKATEGGDRVDPLFEEHLDGARGAGLQTGAYHFYYHCTDATTQARWFIQNVPRRTGGLPPVLDIEFTPTSPTCRTRPEPEDVRENIATFQRIVAAHYGTRPLIYTTVDFWEANDLGRLSEEFWLRSVAGHPSDVYPGARWSFWQYTATGRVPGAASDIDLNAFNGSFADWQTWVARRRQ